MYLTISILIEKEAIQDKIEEVGEGLPICGANLSSPVMDADIILTNSITK
ncbi:MAG: hypothetical protein K0S67_636 [Nitrososphaeraceae archaeon]|jgi:hypothetical protein|nr:hypothetical protein [Nitrososphaeraceae archaeon]MCD6036752.1 hypothetical protein [Nitrososphaeraceae archaeon]MDF2769405.1 hypothetical protein [Nitrososphaeraceae archaeon]